MALEYDLVNRNWRGRGFRGGSPGVNVEPEAPAPVAAPTGPSDSAWQPGSGFRNTGAFRERAMGDAQTMQPGQPSGVQRGPAEGLGEPTSFRGGFGAPPPVAIMRGPRTTFQNPARDQGPGGGYVQTPGSSPVEYATPAQAGQAFIQATEGPAGFRAPGQTFKEAVPGEMVGHEQERLMKAEAFRQAAAKTQREEEKIRRDAVSTEFDKMIKRHLGTPTVGTGGAISHELKGVEPSVLRSIDYARDYALEQGSADSGRKFMDWDRQLQARYPTQYNWYMQNNPAGWYDKVREAGPRMPAVTYPGAGITAPTFAATEPGKVLTGQSPFTIGP